MITASPRKLTVSPRSAGAARSQSEPTGNLVVPWTQGRDFRLLVADHLRPTWHFNPVVVLFMGRRGLGKTLSMVHCADMTMRRIKRYGLDRKLLSNFWISFVDAQGPLGWEIVAEEEGVTRHPINPVDPYLLERLAFGMPRWAQNSTLCIDEAQAMIYNRRSMNRVNVSFTQFLIQIRKRRLEIMFTTQIPQMLDRNALFQIDLFCICEKIAFGKAVKLYVFDYWGQWTGYFGIRPWPPIIGEHDWEILLYPTDQQFGRYRSNEIIAPVGSEQREYILAEWYEESPGVLETPSPSPQMVAPQVVEPGPGEWQHLMGLRLPRGRIFRVGAFWQQAQKWGADVSLEGFTQWLGEQGCSVWKDGRDYLAKG